VPALSSSPIHAVLDQPGLPLDEPAELSLVDALAQVPDPRAARGVRHGVLSVLLISACPVLAGARSHAAIAEHAHDAGRDVLDRLSMGAIVPHESTIRRVLQQLDPAALDAALRSWTLARLDAQAPDQPRPRRPRESRRVLAVDGKTVRGARRPDGTRAHLVAVFDLVSATVLAQQEIAEKGGEVAVFPRLLDTLDLTDVLVTADALHTQRGHATYLHARGGHYLMTVKANQPRLLRRLRALPWSRIGSAARLRARGHGRVESRTISVVSLRPIPDFEGTEFFPHAAQAIKLVRRRRSVTGRWHTATVYAITSLPGWQADPALLAGRIRGHWRIENQLHWVRDVTFDQDRSQVRTAAGPQVMAALRNLAITAPRLAGISNIAAALRHHARDGRRALATYALT
jgi:predicted transposase YbfD/YdcC